VSGSQSQPLSITGYTSKNSAKATNARSAYAVAARALTRRPWPEGGQPRGGRGRSRGQGKPSSAHDCRAISPGEKGYLMVTRGRAGATTRSAYYKSLPTSGEPLASRSGWPPATFAPGDLGRLEVGAANARAGGKDVQAG
jgi:hypothetical protein